MILSPNLPANFTIRILDRMNVHIGIATLEFTDQISNRSVLQRTDQILIRQDTLNNPASYGYTEFWRTEQECDNGAVLSDSSEMDMSLGHLADISNNKSES